MSNFLLFLVVKSTCPHLIYWGKTLTAQATLSTPNPLYCMWVDVVTGVQKWTQKVAGRSTICNPAHSHIIKWSTSRNSVLSFVHVLKINAFSRSNLIVIKMAWLMQWLTDLDESSLMHAHFFSTYNWSSSLFCIKDWSCSGCSLHIYQYVAHSDD